MALLADDYVPAQQLLKRIFPSGLLMYLAQRQPQKVPRRLPVRHPEQARLALHHAETVAIRKGHLQSCKICACRVSLS